MKQFQIPVPMKTKEMDMGVNCDIICRYFRYFRDMFQSKEKCESFWKNFEKIVH